MFCTANNLPCIHSHPYSSLAHQCPLSHNHVHVYWTPPSSCTPLNDSYKNYRQQPAPHIMPPHAITRLTAPFQLPVILCKPNSFSKTFKTATSGLLTHPASSLVNLNLMSQPCKSNQTLIEISYQPHQTTQQVPIRHFTGGMTSHPHC